MNRNAESTRRLTGLAPVIGPQTRLLVLGSFPGVRSLQMQQYYAHPQNHFWKILQALWPADALPAPAEYAERCRWVLAHGMGVWDVYAACEREGSLDTAIRHAELNDFAALQPQCPLLSVVAHNGGESYRHARSVRAALASPVARAAPRVPDVVRLPSSSPANASWSLQRKIDAWREVAMAAGLQPQG